MLISRRIIIVLELIIGLLALGGGFALIAKPGGQALGFDVAILHGFFQSFIIPGVALVAMGLLHLGAAAMTLAHNKWDHVASSAAGAVLVVWISVQVVLIGLTSWTQPVFFLVGNVIFYLATGLWRQGEGPHLGMLEGFENTKHKGSSDAPPQWHEPARGITVVPVLRRFRVRG